MKKFLSLLIALSLVLSFAACGNTEDANSIVYEYIYEEESFVSNVENQSGASNVSGISSSDSSDKTPSDNNSSIESIISSETESSSKVSDISSTDSTPSTDSFYNDSEYESASNFYGTDEPVNYDLEKYTPKSITITFNDSSCKSYGFAWNTENRPINSFLQISKGSSFDEKNFKEFKVQSTSYASYSYGEEKIYPWYSKAVAENLSPNCQYTYRICDKTVGYYGKAVTFKTASPKNESFSFIHFSDSQVDGKNENTQNCGEGTGKLFEQTLNSATKINPNYDFLLHTGDIVEWGKYESYWTNMIDYNDKFFSTKIFNVLTGNHAISYRGGTFESYKHFNVDLTNQDYRNGIYYYFDYGNARFIMLNSNSLNDNKLDIKQYNWLIEKLENNPNKWTIVCTHHALYSPGSWGSDPSKYQIAMGLRSQLSDIFAKHGVDLVIQGHDHVYSKTYPIGQYEKPQTNCTYENIAGIKYNVDPKGTIYVMHGSAGNQTRTPYKDSASTGLYEISKPSSPCSFANITVDNEKITVSIYNSPDKNIQNLVTSYGIKK